MAIPGALVISKIVYPETEESPTRGEISLEVEKTSVNAIDAMAHGAGDGLKVGAIVCAMLIAAIAIISLIDYLLGKVGLFLVSTFFDSAKDVVVFHIDLNHLSLGGMLGGLFHYVAMIMGVPVQDATTVGRFMGTKIVINEFVAYSQMAPMLKGDMLDPKSAVIATFALCGFANFSSVAMLIGGLGELAPERKHDLAKLGIRAMICGTLASYLSASIAGILFTDPAVAADQSIATPVVIMLLGLAIILGFNYAVNHPDKAPAFLSRAVK